MDKETTALIMLIGFPITLAIIAAMIVIPAKRAASIACPRCDGQIPKTDIQADGIRCPHCDWQLERKSENDTVS